ncbi:MAG: type secretion outer membrane protein, TolC family [Acidobacteria bacterium]|nr:type secretion outer membrane protein, TolC family [Acidobacteriota bacterium]
MKRAATILILAMATIAAASSSEAQSTTTPAPPFPTGLANPSALPPGDAARAPQTPAPPPGTVPRLPAGNMPVPTHATVPSSSRLPDATANAEAVPENAGTPMTLPEALARALQVNNTIERSRADIGVANANRGYLFSQVMPRITASGNAIRNSTDVAFGSGTDSRTILPRNDWNYRIVLSQPVYAGNRERRAYEQAKIGVRNAEQGERGTEDAVLLRVASNYLGIIDADARIAVERLNIEQATKRRTQSTAFYEAGESTKVDVLRAETAIKASERLLALAQQQREASASQLRVDLDLDGPIAVARPEHMLPPIPDQATLEHRAEATRPDVIVAQNNLTIAQLEVKKQRGFWLPTVTFDGGWINQKSTFPTQSYSYGALRFNVPLLQSGEVESRVAGAKSKEIQARLDFETAKLNAREDVRRALIDRSTAETSLGLAREQLAAAQAEYNQSFELYRAQESTALDLSEAETSLSEGRRAVAEETLNRDLAELRVWYAAGALKDAVAPAAAR